MPLVVYAYAKCSTCRDAFAWLRARGVSCEERPIYERPPTIPELRRMLMAQDGNLRRLCNTSGIQYRARGLASLLPKMTEDQVLALLASDGRLVKRPFVLGPQVALVGFDAAVWARAIPRQA